MYWFLIVGIFALFVFASLKGLQRKQKNDSVLKQRAVFSAHEQLFFNRLKEALPELTVLARVSFDALITTKLPRTRYKYQNMVADFVILDHQYHVLAVIDFSDPLHVRRTQHDSYKEQLLQSAGYRILHYTQVPQLAALRRDVYPAKAANEMSYVMTSEPSERLVKYSIFAKS
ncbi:MULTISPECIES: DUF2726 domain-containing protein [Acinetobacter]|jgi:very-short-patch-repair endonuclease|uniref:DUF2726 domain-containing protein n=5 Tax=Gammaproteobacteria TaxID=1236 RepID=A0AB38YXT9_9GAMM|nr:MULTISPECIES: DUF2726 domain-containing protein [Acinetobacter]ENV58753.1 hypothetical protein F951_00015 [Acinetobacter soli CIP 110264]ENV61416.1 hypothetical protein F950_00681 [Acinetobacter soli NIPH 2899]KOR16514.1 hypothetical protein ABW55_03345 [Acinetobacter sp. C15]KQC97929.1 hypothetical protein APD01_00800 [Acinetobacter soli]MBO3640811.1 DUF2726 domain-containing protein [Acinetobacter soli]